MEKIKLDPMRGHLVLYCKGHYNVSDVDFLVGLRRIWAIRCGIDFREDNKSSDEYIADELYRIFKMLNPKKSEYFMEILHKEIKNEFLYEGLGIMERFIMIYRNEISMIKVKDKNGKKWTNIIDLPKPKKQVFKRIVRGNGKYNDYKLIAA